MRKNISEYKLEYLKNSYYISEITNIHFMYIPFEQFEHYVNETILKRGLSYFKKGQVTQLDEVAAGNYEAVVSGSDFYQVSIKIEDSLITNHVCDCPYDMGPVCKHMVAVIFAIQQEVSDISFEEIPVEQTPKKKKPGTKPTSKQVQEILEKLSEAELKEFMEKACKKHPELRNYFLATFSYLMADQSKSFYKQQIHSVLKSAAGREEFISWSDTPKMVQNMSPLLENAEQFLENKDYLKLFNFSTALLEEMTNAFDYADDSNGDLGYHIDFSMEMLYKLTEKKLTKELHHEFFEYFLSIYNSQDFSGWPWHLDMLELSQKLIQNEKEANIVLEYLGQVQDDYYKEQAQCLQKTILEKHKSQEEVSQFIASHIGNPKIRRSEIAKALKNKNYERAIKLAKEGIEFDKANKPGLVSEWYNYLLETAQAQNDTENIIKYARILFIGNFRNNQDYYSVLKSNISPEKWEHYVEGLIAEISAVKSRRKEVLLEKIYIREGMWQALFEKLKRQPYLETIEAYEGYLAKDYSPELIALYSQQISWYLNKNMGREHYKTACKYLRRMKKLGGSSPANQLIDQFRITYKQRSALMDELNKV